MAHKGPFNLKFGQNGRKWAKKIQFQKPDCDPPPQRAHIWLKNENLRNDPNIRDLPLMNYKNEYKQYYFH